MFQWRVRNPVQDKLWSNASGRFGESLTQSWKRDITVEFLGMDARVSVSSVQEEIEFWSASLAKFKCIGIKEGLQSMMWEAVFSPPEDPNKPCSLSASHLANPEGPAIKKT